MELKTEPWLNALVNGTAPKSSKVWGVDMHLCLKSEEYIFLLLKLDLHLTSLIDFSLHFTFILISVLNISYAKR